MKSSQNLDQLYLSVERSIWNSSRLQNGDKQLSSRRQRPFKRALLLMMIVIVSVSTEVSLVSAKKSIVLRSVLDRKDLSPEEYSPNNRGSSIVPKMMNWTFGQRRRMDSTEVREPYSWSQPDPRKTYSPPIVPYEESNSRNLFRKEISQLGSQLRPSINFKRPTNKRRHDSLTARELQHPTTDEPLETSSAGPTIENEQSSRLIPATNTAGLVTLIKYIPVLVSVPADQLVSANAEVKANEQKQVRLQNAARLNVPKQFEEVKLEIENNLRSSTASSSNEITSEPNGLMDIGAQSQPAGAYMIQPDFQSLPMSGAKFAYLGPLVPNNHHQSGSGVGTGSTSKAFSAYASKLMSMLRPSALLASMSTGGTMSQAPNNLYSPLSGSMPIYLLAPAPPSDQVRLLQRPTQQPSHSTSADMLLNQASRLHAQSANKASSRPVWRGASSASSQPGLVCLHNLGQPNRSPVEQYFSSTVASLEANPDLSSFDYINTKQVSSVTKGPNRGGVSRESPAKVGQKLAKKVTKVAPVQQQHLIEQQKQVIEDEQQQQQLEQQSTIDTATRQAASKPLDTDSEPSNSTSHWIGRFNSTGSEQKLAGSMIPFTIRDKIELRQPATSDPVQFDDPVDEPNSEGSTSGRPLNTQRKQWLDDKSSSATSFVSLRKRKPQPTLEVINYRKDTGPGHDQIVPMLMASSGHQSGSVRLAPPISPGEVASAASSSVTTSSTLDGQPVALASGELSRSANANDRMILVSSSSVEPSGSRSVDGHRSSTPPPSSTKPVEVVVNSSPEHEVAKSVTGTSSGRTSRSQGGGEPTAVESEQYKAPLSNSFSHDKLLTVDNSMDEFARISAALQTDPLDLIDLQNSRSNFELPSQLESLSMFQHYTPAFQVSRADARQMVRPSVSRYHNHHESVADKHESSKRISGKDSGE